MRVAAIGLAWMLGLPLLAWADDGLFELKIDKEGKFISGNKELSLEAVEKSLTEEAGLTREFTYSTSELDLRLTIEPEAPFGAFFKVFQLARKSRVYRIRLIQGDVFVHSWFPKDRRVGGGPSPKIMRLHFCSTGDEEAHRKELGEHQEKLKSAKVAARTWLWIEDAGEKPLEIDAEGKVLIRVAESASKAADPKDEKDRRMIELCVDPDVPMKHLFEFLGSFILKGKQSLEEERRKEESGEPIMIEPGPFFEFTDPGADRK